MRQCTWRRQFSDLQQQAHQADFRATSSIDADATRKQRLLGARPEGHLASGEAL
jgi:hypothetical protein